MEDEVLITDENLTDLLDQDLAGLEALLNCEEFDIDFTPDPVQIQKPNRNKTCRCGILLSEGPKNEFRCGSCGCIQYKNKEEK